MADTKKSYTSRLIDYLELKEDDEVLAKIKQFASEQSALIEAEREKTSGCFTWGKYKTRKIEDVFKLDSQYCKWALKNGQYLRQDQKELIQSLIDAD